MRNYHNLKMWLLGGLWMHLPRSAVRSDKTGIRPSWQWQENARTLVRRDEWSALMGSEQAGFGIHRTSNAKISGV